MIAKPLILRDEIHGDISLEGVARAVVDHPSFQRLRFIKQLGLAEYVFPCATHTRFQHSLGAAFLARQYFESLVDTLPNWEFEFDGKVERTEFHAKKTREVVTEVAAHPPSRDYWATVTTLSGMLHDVGHGPWSHTFEYLDLPQDFRSETAGLTGVTKKYFDLLHDTKERIWHEDVSVLYVYKILRDLEKSLLVEDALSYFLPVAMLVNKRMLRKEFKKEFETELASTLETLGVRGGVPFTRLLAPLVSGPFDVDRADYIQRDGRNCGVPVGGIEWKRIVRKVMPCLAKHAAERGEPSDVVLVSNLKNQHVLDDFIFSLFQMYVQVYLHPKTVAFEEQIRKDLDAILPKKKPTVNFELHESLSDELFAVWLEQEFQASGVRQILFRQPGHRFQVMGLPSGRGAINSLAKEGYRRVEIAHRPMLKDSVGVFLFANSAQGQPLVLPWEAASPIAERFQSIHHTGEIWIRAE